jgi:phosphomannomutase
VPDLSSLIKAYDVRGVVPDEWDEEISRAIGAAFAEFVIADSGATTVVTAHDMRDSSIPLSRAFAEGVISRGVDVVEAGLGSTDLLYFAAGSLGVPGAMFTASHNPAQYNGMKMALPGALPVSSDTGLFDIRDAAARYLAEGIPAAGTAGSSSERDVLADYAGYLRSLVDLTGIRPLKVVVDAGNGMAGLTTPAVLGDAILPALPLEIEPLYFELDGTFPNHPANPLEPENLADLQAAVTAHGADLGLAFDGDADRCFVLDETGAPVSPSAITALVARREIARAKAAGEPEPVIIHNLITSRAVPELVAAEGGRAVRTRVGHSFIKAVMASEQAVFGGEHSAHYYFRDFFNADTGMLAAMHVLAALGHQDKPLSELAAEYSPYHASGEINSTVADKDSAIEHVLDACLGQDVTIDNLDGTTVTATDGSFWFNLRPSNTEPFLRYNGEARDPATMERIRDQVLTLVRQGA